MIDSKRLYQGGVAVTRTDSLSSRLTDLVTERQSAPDRPSIRQMASAIGISHTYFNALIKGQHENPTMEVMEAIAKFFRTTVDYLWTGKMSVQEWDVLQKDNRFADMSEPSRTRGERFRWVIEHLSSKYSHLSKEKIAAYMEIRLDSLEACLAGKWEPTDQQLRLASQLSGAPIRWLQFGVLAFLTLPESVGQIDPAELGRYIKAFSKAVEHGVPFEILETAIEIWRKSASESK